MAVRCSPSVLLLMCSLEQVVSMASERDEQQSKLQRAKDVLDRQQKAMEQVVDSAKWTVGRLRSEKAKVDRKLKRARTAPPTTSMIDLPDRARRAG